VIAILASNGRSVAQGALAWLWARSPMTLPIPGFRTVDQEKENAAAMRFGPLRTEQVQEIDRLLERKKKVRGYTKTVLRNLFISTHRQIDVRFLLRRELPGNQG
jgi:diketogulonate reductase-like aldo/keto reductase